MLELAANMRATADVAAPLLRLAHKARESVERHALPRTLPIHFIRHALPRLLRLAQQGHLAPQARDYALAAAVLLPVGALAALRLPGVVHRALIFQRSFVDLDMRRRSSVSRPGRPACLPSVLTTGRHGLILYSSVLAAVALAYALSSLDWG